MDGSQPGYLFLRLCASLSLSLSLSVLTGIAPRELANLTKMQRLDLRSNPLEREFLDYKNSCIYFLVGRPHVEGTALGGSIYGVVFWICRCYLRAVALGLYQLFSPADYFGAVEDSDEASFPWESTSRPHHHYFAAAVPSTTVQPLSLPATPSTKVPQLVCSVWPARVA